MFRNLSLILTGVLMTGSLEITARELNKGIINSIAQSDSSKELPLTIFSAEGNSASPAFFLISGDGGWKSFENSFCELLARNGIPVAGLDAKKYFWKAKTPEETTSALVSVIEEYTKKWNSRGFVLAGYSFGADIVPVVANRLPDSLKSKVKLILLLSPDKYGDFEIHVTDMLSLGNARKKYDIVNEVINLKQFHVAAIYGQNEAEVNIQAFRETGIKIYLLPGDHHYNRNIPVITETIIKAISE